MGGYPIPNTYGLEHLFLAFTGYSIGQDGTRHHQYWEPPDLLPILTWQQPGTGEALEPLFTDFLLLATAVVTPSGAVKYLARDEEHPASPEDWQLYLEELFAPGRNLNALFTVSLHNPLSQYIPVDVWVSLPFPHPKVFHNDRRRIAAVKAWVESFLQVWNSGSYGERLTLRGFYWLQESIYYKGPVYDDRYVIRQINNYLHSIWLQGRQLKSLWIPYQKAGGWDQWKSLGFDLSILQPSYEFNPDMLLENGACDAYENGQGVEMEMELALLMDTQKRSRFQVYLDRGARGGMDQTGRYFGPYMRDSVIGWYVGGWYWTGKTRSHLIHRLFSTGDPLYSSIRDFVKCRLPTGL